LKNNREIWGKKYLKWRVWFSETDWQGNEKPNNKSSCFSIVFGQRCREELNVFYQWR
jgi:hypothetical protein